MLTNELGLPQPFIDAAASDHQYQPHRYSVTEVLGGTCEAVLKRRHDGETDEDISDRVWAIFGSAVHKVLQESQATDTQLQEQWLSVPIDDTYELSGIFDLYDDSTGTVTDYKTCSVWKAIFGDVEDWRTQTLLYCWMLRMLGFDAHRGEIVAIMRDHNMREARTKADYPQHPVRKYEWDFCDSDFDEAYAIVTEWFSEVAHEETVEDDYLEPCSPEKRWHKQDTWAVRKKGAKRALKVYDKEHEATDRMACENERAGKDLFEIEHRPGEDTRCQSYCSVAQFCPYGRKFFEDSQA